MENMVVTRRDTVAEMPRFQRVAAYARVSSGKDEMLHSLAAQVSYFSDYIQQRPGWMFAGIYVDEAMTGTKSSRPEFMRMIGECRTGQIDLVLTKSVSRFARNTVDLLETVRELKGLGVDVYFEEQNIHTLSEEGELMLSLLGSFAQAESLSASENSKWQIRKKFAIGELVNLRFMFGYQVRKGKVEIDAEQAEIVRSVFQDYIGGMSGAGIARKLRGLSVPTVLGGTWNGERVLKLIRNEKYTGNALLQKKYVVDHLTKKEVTNKGQLPKYEAMGTHPAIIDQATFDKAQAVLQERLKSCAAKGKGTGTYAFSSIIRCDLCGKNYKRTSTKCKAVWKCTTYFTEGKAVCRARGIPEDTLMSVTADVLGLAAFDKAVIDKHILEIIARDDYQIEFKFHDGHTEERTWQLRSRRESWTDEMRQAAKEHANRRRKNGDKR